MAGQNNHTGNDKAMAKKSRLIISALTILSPIFHSFVCAPQVVAQGLGMPGGPGDAPNGPIDIVANEQEFAGDHVIARGNVRVHFKDSIILAPVATLYRDQATGQPQKAIFTGHPRLTQGLNKIDADTLVFEMASSKIVADGHAHSEVINEPKPVEEPKGKKDKDKDKDKEEVAKAEDAPSEDADSLAAEEEGKKKEGGKTQASGESAPTKIITDSDRQEYDKATGRFEAHGNVRVKAGDILVNAENLKMSYGQDTQPESALFTGHVSATQGQNNTLADAMTYFLTTKRLQATGHVRSKVIQNGTGAQAKPVKKEEPSKTQTMDSIVNNSSGSKSEPLVNGLQKINSDKGGDKAKSSNAATIVSSDGVTAPIIIVSDTQDYNRETGRLDAVGNVKIFYRDTIGIGPKVIVVRNGDGEAEKVVFVGRSQITQPGKRWIADKIVMTVNDRKVLAEGNTKAYILQRPMQNQIVPDSTPAFIPPADEGEEKLAGKGDTGRSVADSKKTDNPM